MAPKKSGRKQSVPKAPRRYTRNNPRPEEEEEEEIQIPTPRRNRDTTPSPPPEELNPRNPQVSMSTSEFQAHITQQIASALATFSAAQNGSPEVSHNRVGNAAMHRSRSTTYTYKDFMSCKPRTFYGNEGVLGYTRWVEKIESVFSLSACPEDSKVMFAACTLADSALTWWNDHVKTMGLELANALEWREFKEMLLDAYCPRQEIQNLEQELWNLQMKGNDVIKYTTRFNDLTNLCPGMINSEGKKIERYIWGLSPHVKGLVIASRPTTYESAKQLAYKIVDQCIPNGKIVPPTEKKEETSKRGYFGKGRGESKRHQPQQDSAAVYVATTANPSPSPNNSTKDTQWCTKCNRHHPGECWFCTHCNIAGHLAKYCRKLAATTTPTPTTGGSRACYECNQTDHFRRDCPKLRSQGGRGRAFVIGHREDPRAPDEDNEMLRDMIN